jgi:hypothetical protein
LPPTAPPWRGERRVVGRHDGMAQANAIVLHDLDLPRVGEVGQPGAQLRQQVHSMTGWRQRRRHLTDQRMEPGPTVGSAGPVAGGGEWCGFHERTFLQVRCQPQPSM